MGSPKFSLEGEPLRYLPDLPALGAKDTANKPQKQSTATGFLQARSRPSPTTTYVSGGGLSV